MMSSVFDIHETRDALCTHVKICCQCGTRSCFCVRIPGHALYNVKAPQMVPRLEEAFDEAAASRNWQSRTQDDCLEARVHCQSTRRRRPGGLGLGGLDKSSESPVPPYRSNAIRVSFDTAPSLQATWSPDLELESTCELSNVQRRCGRYLWFVKQVRVTESGWHCGGGGTSRACM
eukprot:CAMPEP_0175891850 /NCGR_PEP_ID=MMETSP0107_2-20121207/48598_1 /TAXON_ID=195067 ORGANISM="Goniomonas pacifica, Strain CCMP1869" /NCGR_SAMPLE_ID=MMETSP0107_2 /ASSEMBLY_ACC=CAM_ASM_000203 /LENGTH=174 /DNA_ID=CAMNT_0017212743 /DNA_START=187 /DNA_END=711 /DNA_ORIENTATION=-